MKTKNPMTGIAKNLWIKKPKKEEVQSIAKLDK